jgi:hypothetical protein
MSRVLGADRFVSPGSWVERSRCAEAVEVGGMSWSCSRGTPAFERFGAASVAGTSAARAVGLSLDSLGASEADGAVVFVAIIGSAGAGETKVRLPIADDVAACCASAAPRFAVLPAKPPPSPMAVTVGERDVVTQIE